MRGRLWKYVAIAAAALGVLVVGAVVGGNIVFALTRGADVVARVAGARADAASVPVVVAIGPEPAGESEEGIVVASVPPEAPAAEGGVQRVALRSPKLPYRQRGSLYNLVIEARDARQSIQTYPITFRLTSVIERADKP